MNYVFIVNFGQISYHTNNYAILKLYEQKKNSELKKLCQNEE